MSRIALSMSHDATNATAVAVAERDEVIVTSHNLHEVFVIDHSTTTEEARGSTGGRHGKGGDFLYRWGNPQNYDRGTSADRVFYVVHGANWIERGLEGAGNILVRQRGTQYRAGANVGAMTAAVDRFLGMPTALAPSIPIIAFMTSVAVGLELFKYLKEKKRKYSYRFIVGFMRKAPFLIRPTPGLF